jgi:hypothetical protein
MVEQNSSSLVYFLSYFLGFKMRDDGFCLWRLSFGHYLQIGNGIKGSGDMVETDEVE